MNKVTIIDYGAGNLLSVIRAFEHCESKIILADRPELIDQAERLVLPGVGTFGRAMESLAEKNLLNSIQSFAQKQKPFLGICLGMQMMLDYSEEFGHHQGLGMIEGAVKQIPRLGIDGKMHKIPHIGWNELKIPNSNPCGWHNTILQEVPKDTAMYFVHSFAAEPSNPKHRLADCLYDGYAISAVIGKDYQYGCQFHPEKSGEYGLDIIRKFLTF